jgi:predicted transcriptional regulator
MDFKKATEELMAGMTRGEIAEALGVSEATVRQARLEGSAKAHRNPPGGWEAKVAKLARLRSDRLGRLADRLASS